MVESTGLGTQVFHSPQGWRRRESSVTTLDPAQSEAVSTVQQSRTLLFTHLRWMCRDVCVLRVVVLLTRDKSAKSKKERAAGRM